MIHPDLPRSIETSPLEDGDTYTCAISEVLSAEERSEHGCEPVFVSGSPDLWGFDGRPICPACAAEERGEVYGHDDDGEAFLRVCRGDRPV
jgi:hypothetical protein